MHTLYKLIQSINQKNFPAKNKKKCEKTRENESFSREAAKNITAIQKP